MYPVEVNLYIITLSAVMLLKLFEQNIKIQKKYLLYISNICTVKLKKSSVSCWLECICIIVA